METHYTPRQIAIPDLPPSHQEVLDKVLAPHDDPLDPKPPIQEPPPRYSYYEKCIKAGGHDFTYSGDCCHCTECGFIIE